VVNPTTIQSRQRHPLKISFVFNEIDYKYSETCLNWAFLGSAYVNRQMFTLYRLNKQALIFHSIRRLVIFPQKCVTEISLIYLCNNPPLIKSLILELKSGLIIVMASLVWGDILVVFYYFSTSEIWPTKWEGPYIIRRVLLYQWYRFCFSLICYC
jgi:hypothetical protein